MRKNCDDCILQTKTRLKSTAAWTIARAILQEFTLRHVEDTKNYWGLAKCKPCMLAEIIDRTIAEMEMRL